MKRDMKRRRQSYKGKSYTAKKSQKQVGVQRCGISVVLMRVHALLVEFYFKFKYVQSKRKTL